MEGQKWWWQDSTVATWRLEVTVNLGAFENYFMWTHSHIGGTRHFQISNLNLWRQSSIGRLKAGTVTAAVAFAFAYICLRYCK